MNARTIPRPLLAIAFAVALALAALFAAQALTEAAWAHNLGFDSVTNGEKVIVKNRTRFGAHKEGMENWNNVDRRLNGNAVKFEYDNAQNGGPTVVVRDYSREDGRAGFYTTACSPDCIYLNAYYLNGYTVQQRIGTATHELGHSQRFAHAPETDYYRENSVMYPVGGSSGRIKNPGYHDHQDAKRIWVR